MIENFRNRFRSRRELTPRLKFYSNVVANFIYCNFSFILVHNNALMKSKMLKKFSTKIKIEVKPLENIEFNNFFLKNRTNEKIKII